MTAPTAERIRQIRGIPPIRHSKATIDLLAALDHVADRLQWYLDDDHGIQVDLIPDLIDYIEGRP